MVGIYFVWTCFLGCFHCWDSRFSLGKHAVPLGAAEQKLEQEQEQQDKTMRQKQLDGNNKTKVRRQSNNTKATRATRTTTTATTTTTTTPARRYGSVKQMINTNFQGEKRWLIAISGPRNTINGIFWRKHDKQLDYISYIVDAWKPWLDQKIAQIALVFSWFSWSAAAPRSVLWVRPVLGGRP